MEYQNIDHCMQLLASCNNKIVTGLDRLFSDLNLPHAQRRILFYIYKSESPQSVSRIASDTGYARQNVQRVVNQLIKASLVVYETNPYHKRSSLVAITGEGADVAENIRIRLQNWYAYLENKFGKEKFQILNDFLEQVYSDIEIGGITTNNDREKSYE